MKTTCAQRQRAQNAIEKDLLGELSGADRRQLHDHLRCCVPCRAGYDRAFEAFRCLQDEAWSALEIAQVGRWIDEDLATKTSHPRIWTWLPTWTPAWGRLGAGAGTVLVTLALVFWWESPLSTPAPDTDAFVPKGPAHTAALAIDPLCGAPPRPAEQGCDLTDDLSFAYRVDGSWFGASDGDYHLSVFGVDMQGEPRYYMPTPLDTALVHVSLDAEVNRWAPMPVAVRLDVNHVPGEVRIYALLAPVKATVEDVQRWAEALTDADPAGTSRSSQEPWHRRVPAHLLAHLCAEPAHCESAESRLNVQEVIP